MNLTTFQAVAIIGVVAICTFLTRLIPFALFGRNKTVPAPIRYLGAILPPAVIAILVVYCLRSTVFLVYPYGIPEIISVAAVALLHIWKRNNLLSIGLGTVLYMFLIQVVFV